MSFNEGAFFSRAVSCLLKQVPPPQAQRLTTLSPIRAAFPCILILPWSSKKETSSHLFVWLCFPLLMPHHLVLNIKHRIYFLSKFALFLEWDVSCRRLFSGETWSYLPSEIISEYCKEVGSPFYTSWFGGCLWLQPWVLQGSLFLPARPLWGLVGPSLDL